jgi:predicted HNH restriction endonuclease
MGAHTLHCSKSPYNLNLDKFKKGASIASKKYHEECFKKYMESQNYCKSCNQLIPFPKKGNIFCSSSCSAKYNNQNRARINRNVLINNSDDNATNHVYRSNIIDKNMRYSIIENILKKSNSTKELYQLLKDNKISNRSYREYFKTNNINLRELFQKPIHELSTARARDRIIKMRGRKCQQCGWEQVNKYYNKIPVEVHHIDGNDKNNNEDNLIILCPNCHSLTNNYMFYGRSHKNYKGKCK